MIKEFSAYAYQRRTDLLNSGYECEIALHEQAGSLVTISIQIQAANRIVSFAAWERFNAPLVVDVLVHKIPSYDAEASPMDRPPLENLRIETVHPKSLEELETTFDSILALLSEARSPA